MYFSVITNGSAGKVAFRSSTRLSEVLIRVEIRCNLRFGLAIELLALLVEGAPFVVGVADVAEPGSFLIELDGEAEGAVPLPDVELV